MKKQRLYFWPLLVLGFLLGMLISHFNHNDKRTQDYFPQEIQVPQLDDKAPTTQRLA